jgi:hypothetical protein
LELFPLRATLSLGEGRFSARVSKGNMLCVGELEGVTRPAGQIDPIPQFASGAPKWLLPGWQGTIGMTLSLTQQPMNLLVSYWTDEGLVETRNLSTDEALPEEWQTEFICRELRQGHEEYTQQALDEVMADDTTFQFVMRSLQSFLPEALENIYQSRATAFMGTDAQIKHAVGAMIDDGFLPLLDNNTRLLVEMARISLEAASRMDFAGGVLDSSIQESAMAVNGPLLVAAGFEAFVIPNDTTLLSRV